MPLPLPIAPPPPAWEMFVPMLEAARPLDLYPGRSISSDNWILPLDLLRPLATLFDRQGTPAGENFLFGLQAENIAGVGVLPATDQRRVALAWIGLTLREGGRFFNNLRGGCWVCGFPRVGRGRELLQSGDLAAEARLGAALAELGQKEPIGPKLYFNFHYDDPATPSQRVYLLDAGAGRLHGFAFSPTTLAPGKLK